MNFSPISDHSIKSSDQHKLLCLWAVLAKGQPFPSLLKLEPKLQNFDPKPLVIWEIESDDGRRRFRALYSGSRIGEVFNSAWAGKTMDEVIPEPLTEVAIAAADECAATGCAVYTIHRTTDDEGRQIDCERLLLPFGRAPPIVEHVVASLRLVSVDSGFKQENVLENFLKRLDLVLAGKIEGGFSKRHAAAIEASSVSGDGGLANSIRERKTTRHKVAKAGIIGFDGVSLTCLVRDISRGGAALEVSKAIQIPDEFGLIIEMESVERRCAVVWRKDRRIGVRFS